MNHTEIIATTRHWLSSIVIGLNLCPFAQRVFEADRIRYVVSDAVDEAGLAACLSDELKWLAAAPLATIETTLLIHPHMFGDFLDYNDFLEAADDLLVRLDLDGVVQVASFHPAYQFAETEPDAVENFTNRSPYPMLHLLREESVSAIADDEEKLLAIPERNIATLRALGLSGMLQMLAKASIRQTSEPEA
ncbi:MAG: DUF1415 domain-containing protein [Gemmataceae bacterium]|nr:DUF1415 domain-containing protein [Gemmataceae bacterium]